MKPTIEYLRDMYQIGYEAKKNSLDRAHRMWALYHNEHYDEMQEKILKNRGQPKETYNIIKIFARDLLGYSSNIVNDISIRSRNGRNEVLASLFHDTVQWTLEYNDWDDIQDEVKIDALISGVMCVDVGIEEDEGKDKFGRPNRKCTLEYISGVEVVEDPASIKQDHSDGRFVHRAKWLSEDRVINLFGKAIISKLNESENITQNIHMDIEEVLPNLDTGIFKNYNNYLIVHSYTVSLEDRCIYSSYWCGDVLLEVTKLDKHIKKMPYHIEKIFTTRKGESYGWFREIEELQHSINQAIIKIQLYVNTQKVYVNEEAIREERTQDFIDKVNSVEAVIPMLDINGLKIENMSREAAEQYEILNRAIERATRLVAINDALIGSSGNYDSGRKTQLQKESAAMSLTMLIKRFKSLNKQVGITLVNLIKNYYTSNRVLRISDEILENRYIEINVPEQLDIQDEDGQIVKTNVMEEVYDDQGVKSTQPINTEETDIKLAEVDIEISTISNVSEKEQNQIMLETVLNGAVGMYLQQFDPVSFGEVASISIRSMKTRDSRHIADILKRSSDKLKEQGQQEGGMSQPQDIKNSGSQVAKGNNSSKVPGRPAVQDYKGI